MKNLRKKLYICWKVMIFLIVIVFAVLAGFYLYAYITPKMDINKSNRVVLFDKDDQVFYQSSSTSSWVKLSEISDYAVRGIVDTEDKNFYMHNGFDYMRIMKALYRDIKSKSLK